VEESSYLLILGFFPVYPFLVTGYLAIFVFLNAPVLKESVVLRRRDSRIERQVKDLIRHIVQRQSAGSDKKSETMTESADAHF